jgi:protein-S-isoprenylcysteine O-methyltransferase Ste14
LLVPGAVLHLLLLLVPPLALTRIAPDRSDYPVILFLVGATAFYLAERRAEERTPRSAAPVTTAHSRRVQALALTTGIVMLATFWVALAEHLSARSERFRVVPAIGGAVMLVGILLRYAAIRVLGRFFVTEVAVRSAQPLVRSGVYRFVRHPSETGTLAIALGACLLLSSRVGIALWAAALVPVVLLRIRAEDRVLRTAFGDEFRRYAARVKRLLPLLY